MKQSRRLFEKTKRGIKRKTLLTLCIIILINYGSAACCEWCYVLLSWFDLNSVLIGGILDDSCTVQGHTTTDILFWSVKGRGYLCSQCFLSLCQEFKRKLISRGTGCLKSCTPYYGVWSFLKSHKSLGTQVWHLWLEKSWRILRHAFDDYRYLWEVGNVSLWGEGPGPLLLGLESRIAEDLSLDSWA